MRKDPVQTGSFFHSAAGAGRNRMEVKVLNNRMQKQLEEMHRVRQHAYSMLAKLPEEALLKTDPETKRSVRQLLSLYFSHERNHIVQVQKNRRMLGNNASEVQMLLAQADQSRGDLLAALAGLTDAEWAQKPAENLWSIQEILEHLMETENRLLARIMTLAESPAQ
jgi:uncharacterized damage-inducible protein DinB